MKIESNNISDSLGVQTQTIPCSSKIKDFCKKKISLISLFASAVIIGSAFVFATLGTATLITTITLIALICFKNRNKIAKKIYTTNSTSTSKDCSWFDSQQDISPYLNHLEKSHSNVLFSHYSTEMKYLKQTILDIAQKRQNSTEYCTLEDCDCKDSCLNRLEDIYGTKEIQNYTSAALPMNITNSHWVLVFADFQKKTIEYYDSLLNYGPHKKIASEFTELANQIGFDFICKMTTKIQQDSYQCGPWTLYFLEERLKNPQVDFNKLEIKEAQKMIANYRNHIFETNNSQSTL